MFCQGFQVVCLLLMAVFCGWFVQCWMLGWRGVLQKCLLLVWLVAGGCWGCLSGS